MAAAAPSSLASDLFAQATLWVDHDPDYANLLNSLGPGVAGATYGHIE